MRRGHDAVAAGPEVLVGEIAWFQANLGSGLAVLALRDDDGLVHELPCDAGMTKRALMGLTPVLLASDTGDVRSLVGVRVRRWLDRLGVLSSIDAEDVADPHGRALQ